MGGLVPTNHISIAVQQPQGNLFDFHRAQTHPQCKTPLAFPSFLSHDRNNAIRYAQRANFTDREYEIDYRPLPDGHEIVLKKQMGAKAIIWQALAAGQKVPLREGSVMRLADQEFIIKKICQRFSDIDGFQEELRTLSDIDINEQLNLAQSCFRSHPHLRADRTLPKKDSAYSISCEEDSCRVCFGRDGGDRNPLLSLCQCKGSVKNIHYLCLKRWISTTSKHTSTGAYQYYEYTLSCDLCKQPIDRIVTHKGKQYAIYSESLLHPPFVVLGYRGQGSKVREFIINFDHQDTLTLGRSKHCDIPINQKHISPQHCDLIYQNNILYLRNLNPAYGSFINFTEAALTSNDNTISLMLSNHLINLQAESSRCFTSDLIRVRLEDPPAQ